MLKEKLLELNFSPNQADVYLALIELGQTNVGPIITATKFHRNIVYRALDDLMAQKLVSRITKRGVFYYSPLDPEPIIQNLQNKIVVAKGLVKELKTKTIKTQSEVLILSGHQGIIDLYEMILAQGENVYIIGAAFIFPERFKDYIEKRKELFKKKGIKHFVLAQAHTKGAQSLTLVNKVRFLSKNFPASPAVVWVSGAIVAHVLWEKPETIFIIKNKKIAENFRSYFKLLWEKSK